MALSHIDNKLMDDIYQALQYPCYQPFLGRRSNPPTADFIIGIYEEAPIDLLKKYEWQARKSTRNKSLYKSDRVRVDIYADSSLIESAREKKRRDVVISFSQKNRQHSYRLERRMTIDLPVDKKNSSEIDFFGWIED
ncbi:hypothetical protein [Dolosigranulum pigrum]|uniref:hypothetical protein n=1 Tax=Dolosigranulum pigrum TaxID=29394 RepID=UPI00244E1BF7|nr:hypothetical protein [Dolosigranulum pigrum]